MTIKESHPPNFNLFIEEYHNIIKFGGWLEKCEDFRYMLDEVEKNVVKKVQVVFEIILLLTDLNFQTE